MKSSTKRILSILLSALFLIGLIVVITSLVKPEFDKVMQKRSEFYSKEQVFQTQAQAVEEVNQLIQGIDGFNKLQATVSLAMPLSPEIPNILNQLDAIARTSNVTLSFFERDPKPFEEGDNSLVKRLGVLGISLMVEGDYQNLKDFLAFMETNVRVFNVNNYSIRRVSESGGAATYEMEIEADTYYQE
jgi:Tfp pilus assembly protein PilO